MPFGYCAAFTLELLPDVKPVDDMVLCDGRDNLTDVMNGRRDERCVGLQPYGWYGV